jgi:SAM-dependent methyltransferase
MAPRASIELERLHGGEIDWNEAWRVARASATRKDSQAWDQRAPSFARHAGRSAYVEAMLELLDLDPDWTLLDVGCGPGTLALPLAHRVRSVTALDFSPRMLDLLRERCAAQDVRNVVPVLGAWEDDWAALGLDRFDVALASRSLNVSDLRGALLKLHGVARRQAVITAPVGDGPMDRRVFEAAGRTFVPGPDYRYVYNMLRQLGLSPEVSFIPVTDARRYASLDEAVEGLAWMLTDPAPHELACLREWLGRAMVAGPDGLGLSVPRTTEWAVVSWSTGGIAPAAPR